MMANSGRTILLVAGMLWNLVFLAYRAEAETILIDFGTVANTTSVDTNGNRWNNLTGGELDSTVNPRTGTIPLVDIANSSALGISMNYAYPNTGDNFGNKNATNHSSQPTLSNLGLMDIQSAKQDVLWSSGSPTLTFTGLNPTSKYSFSIFAYRSQSGRTSNFQLTGSTASSLTSYAVDTSITAPGNVLKFIDYSPNGSNQITLQITPGTGGYAYISALQIDVTPVPEPSTLALLGLGSLIVLRRAVRRYRSS